MAITRYPLETDEIKSIDARLLYVTYSKYENDWPSRPHTHPFTELCYIIRGNGKYIIEDSEYVVRESDFIIVNDNVSHTEMSVGEVPLEYIILGVEGLKFSWKDNHESVIFNFRREHSEYLFYMNTLLKEMEQQQPDYELICRNYLEILIVKLTRRSILAYEATPMVKASKECIKLKQYLENFYGQDITLDTLADISHLNKFYLVHAFTKMFGCSPISYLCKIRIKASQELLITTDYSITEVAHFAGFSSQSYFAQCFFKNCNMTASAYRKQYQEKKMKLSSQT